MKPVKLLKEVNVNMAIEEGERRQHNLDHMVHVEPVAHLTHADSRCNKCSRVYIYIYIYICMCVCVCVCAYVMVPQCE